MTREKRIEHAVSAGVFLILLATYWLTAPDTVSYWDCPEYVAGAWKMEVGHPPGNPVWMLVERVITMLAPSGKEAALLVNFSSGLFTALAAFFLSKTIFAISVWITRKSRLRRHSLLLAATAATIGTLAFGWCDSTWYSAVEAEVYAMSIFFTSLCVWLMVEWAQIPSRLQARRLLVLLAYLFGLSIGVHQLNLLCIPALAIIWGIRRGIRSPLKFILIFILSLAAVGCVLVGMMPSAIALAAGLELLAVNTLGLPYLWGVGIYVVLLAAALLLALTVTARSHNRGVIAAAIFPAIFLSGIFNIGNYFLVGAAVSAIASILLVRGIRFDTGRLNLAMWMLAMLLTGYSAYAIIPLRGDIPSPANPILPGDPFSFAAYQAREQYGSSPLLYGQTPYSKALLRETFRPGDSVPDYSKIALTPGHRYLMPKVKGGILHDPYDMLTASDSAFNRKALERKGDAYVVRGYSAKPILTPELNMWFPRITSRDPEDLDCFADWTGMTPENMTKVQVSEVIDSAGRILTKLDREGKRTKAVSKRPTYAQSLGMLFSYQMGYMYFRYLLWNFSGRQNDIHSTGEVEHGNFITGFLPIDNLMLGAEHYLPAEAGSGNPGRNRYFMLPLLLGLVGIGWLIANGRRGRETAAVMAVLFVMTGLAIVVYLNQGPGEPRERDYSFLGSYMAFAAWIGFGAVAVTAGTGRLASFATRRKKTTRRRAAVRAGYIVGACLCLGVPLLMFFENLDDHDRSGRRAASSLSANLLNSLEKDAIIFVDGDNYTFPLWYSQEVEGVRKDVRVINMAYLSLPQYAAMMMRDWDGAKGIPSVFKPEDIIYSAFLFPEIAAPAKDSVADAAEMIRQLRESKDFKTHVGKVSLPIGRDTVTIPLSRLTVTGAGRILNFRKLMILNILAANAESKQPRPIYWHRSLPGQHLLGLGAYTSPSLAGPRLGKMPDTEIDSIMRRTLDMLQTPNAPGYVYMDGTPAGQVSAQRASLVIMARELLRRGHTATALKTTQAADSLMGRDRRTFGAVLDADTTFIVRKELGKLYLELADTTGRPDLREKGDSLLNAHRLMLREWTRYKRALPPRLRSKMLR